MTTPLADEIAGRVAGGRQGSSPFAPSPEDGAAGGTDDDFGRQPLFRPEALRRPETGFGQPVAYLPVSWRWLAALLIAMVAAGIYMLFTNSYERREMATGLLRSAQGETQIMPRDRGMIRSMRVAEGQRVRANQILAVVSTDRLEESGRVSVEDVLRTLDGQEISLRGRLAALQATDSLEGSALGSQLDALDAQLFAARADLSASTTQYEMAEEDHRRTLPVAKRGFISLADMRRREQAIVQGKQAVANATGNIARLTAQIAEQRTTIAKRPFNAVRERGQVEDMLTDIAQRRTELRMGRGYAIRSPVDGMVTALQTGTGQAADPQRPLMSIVPDGAQMVAVLYVPSRGIGLVKAGQSVRLRYHAFPFQTFGAARARIKAISHTVLKPEEVEAAIRLEEPAYRIVAELDRQTMPGFGREHALQPGMALDADIVLERRSFAAWLFDPLIALKGRIQ